MGGICLIVSQFCSSLVLQLAPTCFVKAVLQNHNEGSKELHFHRYFKTETQRWHDDSWNPRYSSNFEIENSFFSVFPPCCGLAVVETSPQDYFGDGMKARCGPQASLPSQPRMNVLSYAVSSGRPLLPLPASTSLPSSSFCVSAKETWETR